MNYFIFLGLLHIHSQGNEYLYIFLLIKFLVHNKFLNGYRLMKGIIIKSKSLLLCLNNFCYN